MMTATRAQTKNSPRRESFATETTRTNVSTDYGNVGKRDSSAMMTPTVCMKNATTISTTTVMVKRTKGAAEARGLNAVPEINVRFPMTVMAVSVNVTIRLQRAAIKGISGTETVKET